MTTELRDITEIARLPEYQRNRDAVQVRLLDLPQIAAALRRHAARLIAIVAALLVAAMLYKVFAPSRYTAEAVVLVEPREARVVTSEQVLGGIGQDTAAVESQVGLIRSAALAARVVDDLRLQNDPEFDGRSALSALVSTIVPQSDGAAADKGRATQRAEAIKHFRDRLDVERRGLTYVLEINFTSRDPDKAARIANAVADTYLLEQVELKSNVTSKANDFLNERIEELRDRLARSEEAVAAFKDEHDIVDLGADGSGQTLIRRQIERLNQQLINARGRAADARAQYEQVRRIVKRSGDPGSLPEALTSDVIARLRVEHAKVARIEAEYASRFRRAHPALKSIRSQSSKLRGEITSEMARILKGAENQHDIARNLVTSLEDSLAELNGRAAVMDRAGVQLKALRREAEANRELYESFLTRAKQTREQKRIQTADARIVSHATAPVEPSSPGAALVLALALAAGGGLGLGYVLVAESLSEGYRTPQDLAGDVGLTCFGACTLPASRRLASQAGGFRLEGFHPGRGESRTRSGRRKSPMRAVLDQPGSPCAGTIRAVRLGLFEPNADVHPRVAVVVSAQKGDGRPLLASNLAHDIARTGKLTLLIDADTLASELSARLARPRTQGLTDIIEENAELQRIAKCDPGSGLYFLPLGQNRIDENDTDFLVDGRLGAFLDKYREIFDVIVIDGPPALASPDCRYVLGHADSAVLVAARERTGRDTIFAALDALGTQRRKIRGCVLMDAGT